MQNSPHPAKATLSPHPMRGEGRVRGAVGHSIIGFISEIYLLATTLTRLEDQSAQVPQEFFSRVRLGEKGNCFTAEQFFELVTLH